MVAKAGAASDGATASKTGTRRTTAKAPEVKSETAGGLDAGSPATADAAPASRPSRELIAERAYLIYEREGRPDGRDREHWLLAEAELGGYVGQA